MKMKKRFIVALGMVTMIASLTACGKKETKNESVQNEPESTSESGSDNTTGSEDYKNTTVTLKIKDYGDIKLKFYPDDAPKAVENFITHAKDGYFDGVTFHRVINNFMIQGGDPEGTGMGGESIWGSEFEDEISPNLLPIRGSLCMANAGGGNTNGSQFFIVQSSKKEEGDIAALTKKYLEMYKQQTGCPVTEYTQAAIDEYSKVGGCLYLAGGYTVFGQVEEGLDVVDKIAQTSTDENDKPTEDVIIEKAEVTEG